MARGRLTVRKSKAKDYEEIAALQQRRFPNEEPWSREEFLSHLKIFPQGQIVVTSGGKLVAASSSMITNFDLYRDKLSWPELTGQGLLENHNPHGDTLLGVELVIDPEFVGLSLEQRIYDARKQLARELNLARIIIGSRIAGYHEYQSTLAPREYVDRVINNSIFDAILSIQLDNGFSVKRLVEDYFPAKTGPSLLACFVEWTNVDYQPVANRIAITQRPIRVCAVQYKMRPVKNFEEFATQCEYFVDVASGYRCDFVLFPELLTLQLLSCIKEEQPGKAARKLAGYTPQYIECFTELALKHNINIIAGSHFVLEGERLLNCAYLFHRSGEVERQEKLHITPSEKRWWGVSGGEKLHIFKSDRGPLSIQICYDVEFPELGRMAAENGAEVIFVPFCTDERHGYLRVRYCAQARCIENQLYTVIAGTVGNLPQVDNFDIQYAQSAILTPSDFEFSRDGIAAECTPNTEMVIIHDLDLEALRRHKEQGTTQNWGDRRSDLYRLIIS